MKVNKKLRLSSLINEIKVTNHNLLRKKKKSKK